MPALLKVAKFLGKALKKYLKGKSLDSADKIIKIFVAILSFIILIIFMIIMMIKQLEMIVFCDVVTLKNSCPQPLVTDKEMYNLGTKIQTQRNNQVNNIGDEYAELFREDAKTGIDLTELTEEEKEQVRFLREVDLMLKILLDIDKVVYFEESGSEKDFSEGGKYYGTNFGRTMQYAIDTYEQEENTYRNFWGLLNSANREQFFFQRRLDIWECYLIDNCGIPFFNFNKVNLLGDLESGIMINTKNDNEEMKYQKLAAIYNNYYPYSLFYGLENGEERFNEALNDAIEKSKLLEHYPPQNKGKFGGFSFGWHSPMEDKTAHRTGWFDEIRSSGKHASIDLGAPLGTPIYAARGGKVVVVAHFGGYANSIAIDHQDGYYSFYAHMKMEDIVVKVGQDVQAGQLIGGVGNEGSSQAPHLHFEICSNLAMGGICEKALRMDPEKEPFHIEFTPRFQRDDRLANEKASWFFNIRERAKAGEIFIREGVTGMIGTMAAEYESNGDPGICTWWDTNRGGLTCGAYQIETQYGTMAEFIKFTKANYPDIHQKLIKHPLSTKEFETNWRRIADEDSDHFYLVQHMFIFDKLFLEQRERLINKGGFDALQMSVGIQEMIFSMAVQHRNYTHTIIAEQAGVLNGGWERMTEEEIVRKMYDVRKRKWPAYKNSRYIPEESFVLEHIKRN